MPLDVSAQQLLDQTRAAGGKPMESLPLAQARAGYVRSRLALAPDPPQVAEVRDLELPCDDHSLRVRLYRGFDAPPETPVMAFFHGGGWALGNLDSHDSFCRGLANEAKCAVVAVDYRLAPEHKFPAAVEDAEAAVTWLAIEGTRLGLDPSRIAVAGDSAGGNLAAVVALASRESGAPKLRLQVLIYASLDLGLGHDSHRRVGEGYTLTASAMRWFRDMYLRRPEDAQSWRASPLRQEDLTGVAPAFIVVGGCDPLCDESADYAQRLIAAGVDVTYRFYPGQMHGFVPAGRVIPEGRTVCAEIASALRSAFATAAASVRA